MAQTLDPKTPLPAEPPGAWLPARRLARRALAPVESFLRIEAASGILLVAVTVLALVWANSPWRASYAALWHLPLAVRVGTWSISRDMHFVINDGLMTIFFFVVGLEIRREIAHGELSRLRRAALPLVAALGGMIAPAILFAILNRGLPSIRGWGVPTATDIAFAVGVLTLLGKRVPPALRILLLALAVIDDVGAILVIALFYSSGLAWSGLGVAAAGIGAILVLQWVGVRKTAAYVVPAIVVWAGCWMAGIHPTLAGVIVGLMTPVRAWLGRRHFVERADANVAAMRDREDGNEHELLPYLDDLKFARREAVSPVERLQHELHGWVAYAIMPLFALANAGIPLGRASFEREGLATFLGVVVGLGLGKPLGILAFSSLAVRMKIASMPAGIGVRQLSVVGLVAGIGFTMAMFIANLAFEGHDDVLETAKLGILVASTASAVVAYVAGRVLLGKVLPAECAKTDEEAEQSTAL